MLTAALACAAPGPARAQDTAPFDAELDLHIAAQPLAAALSAYAKASGVDILYVQGLTAGRTSTAVSGRYTEAAALRQLLQGAGLEARFTSRKAAIIFAVGTTPAPPQGGPGAALPSVHLDTAQVRALTIGGADGAAWDAYAQSAGSEIREVTRRDPSLEAHKYHLVVALQVGPSGQVDSVRLVRGSGDASLDARLARTLAGHVFGRPPLGPARPLRFEIATER